MTVMENEDMAKRAERMLIIGPGKGCYFWFVLRVFMVVHCRMYSEPAAESMARLFHSSRLCTYTIFNSSYHGPLHLQNCQAGSIKGVPGILCSGSGSYTYSTFC
jgi:hypothetical protein